jgi:hypothetical protein
LFCCCHPLSVSQVLPYCRNEESASTELFPTRCTRAVAAAQKIGPKSSLSPTVSTLSGR